MIPRLDRFALVSAVCFLLNGSVMVAADRAGLPLAGAVASSFAVVVAVGYMLHSRLTFRSPPGLLAFARYAAAMSLNVPASTAATWMAHDGVGLPMAAAAPIAGLCVTALSLASCRIVFRPSRAPGPLVEAGSEA